MIPHTTTHIRTRNSCYSVRSRNSHSVYDRKRFVRCSSAVVGTTHTNGRAKEHTKTTPPGQQLDSFLLPLSLSFYSSPSLCHIPATLPVAAALSRRRHSAFCGSSHSHANRMQPPQLRRPFTTTALNDSDLPPPSSSLLSSSSSPPPSLLSSPGLIPSPGHFPLVLYPFFF